MLKRLGLSILMASAVTTSVMASEKNVSTKKGAVIRPNIVGGENALAGEFPFIVSLRSKSYGH